MSTGLPDGFETEVLPDGTVRLARTRFSHVNANGFPIYLLLLAGVYLTSMVIGGFGGSQRWTLAWGSPLSAVFSGVYVLALLAAAAYGVARLLTREEWRVGPDLLEVKRTLLGRTRVQTHRVGKLALRVRQRYTGRSTHRFRQLVVESSAGRQVLAEGSLTFSRHLPEEIGQYLAARTGWPIEDRDPDGGLGLLWWWG